MHIKQRKENENKKEKRRKQLNNKATMFDNRQGRICNQNEHIIHRKKKEKKNTNK